MIKKIATGAAIILTASLGSTLATADGYKRYYEVIITNISQGQTFTPQLVVTHANSVKLFELGEPASAPLELLAESGSTAETTSMLMQQGHRVSEVQTVDGLLALPTLPASMDGKRAHCSIEVLIYSVPSGLFLL